MRQDQHTEHHLCLNFIRFFFTRFLSRKINMFTNTLNQFIEFGVPTSHIQSMYFMIFFFAETDVLLISFLRSNKASEGPNRKFLATELLWGQSTPSPLSRFLTFPIAGRVVQMNLSCRPSRWVGYMNIVMFNHAPDYLYSSEPNFIYVYSMQRVPLVVFLSINGLIQLSQ